MNLTILDCKMKVFFSKRLIWTIHFNFELTSSYRFLFSDFLLIPLSFPFTLFIGAPMHTMHVRVQDMHAVHDSYLVHFELSCMKLDLDK